MVCILQVLNLHGGSAITEIKSGSAIGELYLMQSYPHIATVRCGTECDIMVLNKQDFKEALSLYPENLPILLQRLEVNKIKLYSYTLEKMYGILQL